MILLLSLQALERNEHNPVLRPEHNFSGIDGLRKQHRFHSDIRHRVSRV